jgi:hypothetical protein
MNELVAHIITVLFDVDSPIEDLYGDYRDLALPKSSSVYTKILKGLITGDEREGKSTWNVKNIVAFLYEMSESFTNVDFSLATLAVNDLYNRGVNLWGESKNKFVCFTDIIGIYHLKFDYIRLR